jgi:hypothetical protein
MKKMTPEEWQARLDAIKAGRNKDRDYNAYVSDSVKRMKGKPRSQYMSHNTAAYRIGGN